VKARRIFQLLSVLMLSDCTTVACAADRQTQQTTAVTLYGRIEQLVNQKGATLPGRLRKLTPVLDLSPPGPSEDRQFSGIDVRSFPMEWEGIWKGLVTVKSRENAEMGWLSQPAACYRACQFFKPGSRLTLVCRFHKEDGKLTLSPPVVTGRFKHAQDLVQAILAATSEVGDRKATGTRVGLADFDLGQKTMPIARIESFSFGKRYGPSAGGNFVDTDLISNELRELAPGTVEQDLVTSNTSSSLYGAPDQVSSLAESVVRLRRDGNKLIVSLAYVNYQPDGISINKCFLEGTLERTSE
jgi:hypothetical protein